MLAPAGLTDRLAVDVQGAQALRARAAQNDPAALQAAARQFEALVVQMLLKTMRETSFTTPDDPLAHSDAMKLYRELLDQQWAQKIAAQRGLGFADTMAKHLSRQAALVEAGGPAAVPAASTESSPQASPARTPPEAVPAARAEPAEARERFLQTLRPHAETAARLTGVPADFILAHAALESGWGEAELTAADGRRSHNLFGIKAGAGWTGDSMTSLTTEYRHGLAVKTRERFRAYADYTEAFTDYAALLKRRYAAAVEAGGDAAAFSQALAQGGYASDPAYADKLQRVIASVQRAVPRDGGRVGA